MRKTICLVFCLVFLLGCQDKKAARAEISFTGNELPKSQESPEDTPEQNKNAGNGEKEFPGLPEPEDGIIAESHDALVLSYQKEIEEWLADNDIASQAEEEIMYKTIKLFVSPKIVADFPPSKPAGKVETYDCFALGRFLSISEAGDFLSDAYTVIPKTDKETYYPLNNIAGFENALVFNVSNLFNSPFSEGLNADYIGDYAYLFCLFKTEYTEPVFDTQYNQLKSKQQKNFLIIPYSFYYALFRIDREGIIEFVVCYGVN
jgi:hypothetical protein